MTENSNGMNSGTRYQIMVKGHLYPGWSDWFGGLVIQNLETGQTRPVGPVIDGTALRGLLNKLWDIGLRLVYLYRIDCELGEESAV